MEGTRCDEQGCETVDFLPFSCPQCEGKFCLHHRSRFSHSCICDVNPNQTVVNKPQSTFDFKKKIESVTSRFDQDTSGLGDSKSHFSIKSSTQGSIVSAEDERISKKIDTLSALETKKPSNAAKKTKEILIAKNAKGNASIAGRDRFFLIAQFPETEKELHLFFSVSITLGEALNQIANMYPLVAFGTVNRPADKSLRLYTEDTCVWKDWDVTACISKILTSFETVSIISVNTTEAVEAQAALLHRLANPIVIPATTDTDTAEGKNDSQTPVPQYTFEVGSLAVYKTSSGVLETVRIVAIHRDDFPNVYYTIRQPSGNERQTDSNRLTPRSIATTGTSSNTKANTITGPSSTEVFDPQSYPVLISYQGKVYTVNGVLDDQIVSKLHTLVAQQISPFLPSPISLDKVSLKLIYKGKILHVNENVRIHKLTRNCKLTLIVSSK